MSLKCGIVGLPNVGKSTLFNALTNSNKAQAENFPFCTIDPNIGVVPVPDQRLENLAKVSNSKKIINTTISFVDIAGLVEGASKGEGLGNKFLSHIREVDAIIHMIRCFDSDNIQNVNSTVNPVRDLEIIETEMKLADLDSIQKRLEKNNRKNIDDDQLKILEIASDYIDNDKDLSLLKESLDKEKLNQTGLLSLKPKIFVCNVDEQSIKNGNNYTKNFINKFSIKNTLIISADIENQINGLDHNEKKNYMKMLGLEKTGLDILIKKGYEILELETFFTSGPEETRAWTIEKNCVAPKAAGKIHTDFEKGFIRAETVSYDDFIKNSGWLDSKTNGKMRLEGKNYIVKDGPNADGEMFTRPGKLSDKFVMPYDNVKAAQAANGGAYPPDMSVLVKARGDGVDYIYSLLQGYEDPPAGVTLDEGVYYNKYMYGNKIKMANQLSDGLVEYSDGTNATVEQMSKDVTTFLMWSAEPHLESRHQMGFKAIVYLIILTILVYFSMKKIWSRIETKV